MDGVRFAGKELRLMKITCQLIELMHPNEKRVSAVHVIANNGCCWVWRVMHASKKDSVILESNNLYPSPITLAQRDTRIDIMTPRGCITVKEDELPTLRNFLTSILE
jgi:hypothetical protein